MKNILSIICILFSSGLFAQGVYNNGAKIVIGSGVTLYVGGNYQNETNVSDGSMDLSGTVKLAGNYTNNVAAADAIGTAAPASKLELIGTAAQTLGGTTSATFTFPDLTINNSAGVVISKNSKVTGALTLTSGLVDIGSSNLTFGPTASVAGTPSASSMIVATGTGEVRKEYSGVGSFTFPVGDNTATAEYSPVSLNFISGTFDPGAYAGVNLVNAAFADPYISGSFLNRYWNVTQSSITSFTCDAAFNYPIADVVGTESEIYGVRIIPTPVFLYGTANGALHQFTATGLTSFGTFTGALGQRNLNLTSVLLQGLYNGVGIMRQAWDAAGPHWPAGVADHITVELHDANTYATIVNTTLDVPFSITGSATVTFPATFNASYYITIKHRNSIETTTATATSFAGSNIDQSFGSPADVYGGNLALSADTHYLIYGGDVNQDGSVDSGDFPPVVNDNSNYMAGYLNTDIDGNGSIDSGDYPVMVNNNSNYVGTNHP